MKKLVLLMAISTMGATLGCQSDRNCDTGCCDPCAGSCSLQSLGSAHYPQGPAGGDHMTPPGVTPGPPGNAAPMNEPYDGAPGIPAPGPAEVPTDAALLPTF